MTRGRKQAWGLLVVVVAAAFVGSLVQVASWARAESLLEARIVSVSTPHRMRRSTGRRYELTVMHRQREIVGLMTTYWWTGDPEAGEVVDLRVRRDEPYAELYFDAWARQFAGWLVVALIAATVGGLLAWRRARSRSTQRPRPDSSP